jgi:hypothetical protein
MVRMKKDIVASLTCFADSSTRTLPGLVSVS